MRRKLVTFASVVSLLLSAGTVALWVRSYWVGYACGGTTPGSLYSVSTSRGRICIALASSKQSGFTFYQASSRPPQAVLAYGPLGKLGFFFDNRRSANGAARVALVLPAALLPVAALFLPGCWLLFRARRRYSTANCLTCSYNLTGNTSGVCPECGTAIKSKDVPVKIA